LKHPESYRHDPILILGAGRSGTKLLRGIIASHPRAAAFPREINYIWRHGNALLPTDELRPEHARARVVRYVRQRFRHFQIQNSGKRIVEKTCANTLRLEFIHAVFPEAHIIHLIRDGRAVAESARRCWQAPPDTGYLWEKARWLPWSDAPYYALRYLCFQMGRIGSDHRAQSSWGPRFAGIDGLTRTNTLIEVCGLQWKACVQAACAATGRLPHDQVTTLRYEDLVTDPLAVTKGVFEAIGLPLDAACREHIRRKVSQDHLDKWQHRLSAQDMDLLLPHIESQLQRHGYKT